jgi:hypothetical protein
MYIIFDQQMHKVFINKEIVVNKYFEHLLLKYDRKTKCGLFAP